MGKNTIQVVKRIDKSDKKVIEALNIAANVKILPYNEVEKLLDKVTSDFSLAKAKG